MVFSNKFSFCIILNGRILQEDKAGNIAIPFGSEYKVRLINKNNKRCVATILIDDENVSDGGYIVPANGHVDIERYASTPKKFKLARPTSYEAFKEGKGPRDDGANGVIKVGFWLEKIVPYVPAKPSVWKRPEPFKKSWPDAWSTFGPMYMGSNSSLGEHKELTSQNVLRSCSLNSVQPEEAVTVKGSHSAQQFREVSFTAEETATYLTLILKGTDGPIVLYCDGCGSKKHRDSARFCSQCGNRLNA